MDCDVFVLSLPNTKLSNNTCDINKYKQNQSEIQKMLILCQEI